MFRTPSRCPHSTRALLGIVSLAITALLITAELAVGDDWPFFRGPNFNGVSTESGWVAEWPEAGPKAAWRANVGIGASSVVVVGNRRGRDHGRDLRLGGRPA